MDYNAKPYEEYSLKELVDVVDPSYNAKNEMTKYGIWEFDFLDPSKKYPDSNGLYEIE